MIKFFRHIRQKLVNQNRFSKYMLYAIGEIILVVIGILIALQINNTNEAKANKARFESVLKEIKTDLETDVLTTEILLKFGKKSDSLMRRVLDEDLTIEDYKNEKNERLLYLGLYHQPFEYLNTGFHKFEIFQELVPESYGNISKLITRHYTKECENFDSAHARSKEISNDRQNYLIQNYAWYHLLEKRERPDDMIAFYLKNPIYKNWIYQSYNYNTFGENQSLYTLQKSAINLIGILSVTLDVEIANAQQFKDLFGKPLEAKDKALDGTYKGIDNTREFSLNAESDYLLYESNEILGFLKKIKDDKYQSAQYPNWYYDVVRDDNGKVIEFVMNNTENGKIYRCKKVL